MVRMARHMVQHRGLPRHDGYRKSCKEIWASVIRGNLPHGDSVHFFRSFVSQQYKRADCEPRSWTRHFRWRVTLLITIKIRPKKLRNSIRVLYLLKNLFLQKRI